MSKDKGGKNAKKAPATEAKKAVSDYQAGLKKTASKEETPVNKKK